MASAAMATVCARELPVGPQARRRAIRLAQSRILESFGVRVHWAAGTWQRSHVGKLFLALTHDDSHHHALNTMLDKQVHSYSLPEYSYFQTQSARVSSCSQVQPLIHENASVSTPPYVPSTRLPLKTRSRAARRLDEKKLIVRES